MREKRRLVICKPEHFRRRLGLSNRFAKHAQLLARASPVNVEVFRKAAAGMCRLNIANTLVHNAQIVR